MRNIAIEGAKIHNLKKIDVTIPKNKISVITGISGSGKSSLAFDIVSEEGQKQYLKSIGVFSDIEIEDRCDKITGLGPTIAVKQNIQRQTNPLSTVGSKTNILRSLSMLYALVGEYKCPVCGLKLDSYMVCDSCKCEEERLTANYFSYNSPDGMCIRCSGRGSYLEIDMSKLVPTDDTTLRQIFSSVNPTPGYTKLLSNRYKEYLDIPFKDIQSKIKADIIYGQYVSSNAQNRSYCIYRILEGRYLKDDNDSAGLIKSSTCDQCKGNRISQEALEVCIDGINIGQLSNMTITEAYKFLDSTVNNQIYDQVALNIYVDIRRGLLSLIKSKLGHLTLYRETSTLSGGELQRLLLNTHLNSDMDSIIYVLDEPTSGLHECEKKEIIDAIKRLKSLGNTIIIVEHDKDIIASADYVIDIGPKAGINGGQVIYQGTYDGLLRCKCSITSKYLSEEYKLLKRNIIDTTPLDRLNLKNARINNLKDITIDIPLNALVGIAGVAGSGKSSLISKELVCNLSRHFKNQDNNLDGANSIDRYIEVAQIPIGRNRNSNIVSYLGIWDKIRRLYAEESSKSNRKMTSGHFSFNSKGACKECGGSGIDKLWLGGSFFISQTCKVCSGNRFNDDALSISYKDKNIADVLEMSVAESMEFFKDDIGVMNALTILNSTGMGYIKLGQLTTTLSGGEAQRLKLAREIGKKRPGRCLFILDEPTNGLSPYDTERLITLLDELVGIGHSVIVVEHNADVLSECDWLIELGPSSGEEGGEIIATGTPRQIHQNKESITGRYLNV